MLVDFSVILKENYYTIIYNSDHSVIDIVKGTQLYEQAQSGYYVYQSENGLIKTYTGSEWIVSN